ncbi:uncharacterized protein PHALS_07103 [Plasmopara halstedii]|uniref:Uncharacterized protein n=1 Tax=Plasmopara halstedii TaxID=4781 RepID=A0A0P1B5N1_PLAHL|nr:uncharacterized protein PHALS_07103 [Plasmopara halstedii]CEG49334.1 hypothetical protein PHALS_07103 [Plasmopara halstedii]|eukprot:XP_024585703.1 hypothetical protein PHALS_07103 [Plasmopara halstedii]
MQTQKENVDTNAVVSNAAARVRIKDTKKCLAPKRGFVIHNDAKTAKQSGSKDKKSVKSRRVLGDISNNQQNCHDDNHIDDVVSNPKGVNDTKKLRAGKKLPLMQSKRNAGTQPPKALEERKALTSRKLIERSHTDEIPDIELAYGGLTSPKSKSVYMKELRDEFLHDIIHDQTPTLFDDFDPTRIFDDWNVSHEPAFQLWTPPNTPTKEKTEVLPVTKSQLIIDPEADNLSDLPPPDNLPEDAVDCDILLEDILSVDIEAGCSE